MNKYEQLVISNQNIVELALIILFVIIFIIFIILLVLIYNLITEIIKLDKDRIEGDVENILFSISYMGIIEIFFVYIFWVLQRFA